MVGSSRVTVTQVLNRFRSSHWIGIESEACNHPQSGSAGNVDQGTITFSLSSGKAVWDRYR